MGSVLYFGNFTGHYSPSLAAARVNRGSHSQLYGPGHAWSGGGLLPTAGSPLSKRSHHDQTVNSAGQLLSHTKLGALSVSASASGAGLSQEYFLGTIPLLLDPGRWGRVWLLSLSV